MLRFRLLYFLRLINSVWKGIVQGLPATHHAGMAPFVFETHVGVKYIYGLVNSVEFDEYVIREEPFATSSITFSDLIFPPDLLCNYYTLCGTVLDQSPHFRLMDAYFSGRELADTDYMFRCHKGTLDVRLPIYPQMGQLMQKMQLRREEILKGLQAPIYLMNIRWQDRSMYIVLDGKHRAAMATYLNHPGYLCVRTVSNAFVQHPYFHKNYSYVLRLNSQKYSINQEMIAAIFDAS